MAQQKRFPSRVPRLAKVQAGKTDVGSTPLTIRGGSLDPATREHVRGRITRTFGKYSMRIERITVRFDDVNGPRGGVDARCRIKVVIAHLESVVVEALAETAREAFDRAAASVGRAVRKALARAGFTEHRSDAR